VRDSDSPCRERAIFLDRDGTLNVEVDTVMTPDDIRLIDGAGEAVYQINRAGYRAIVVTNQAVIARGESTEQEVRLVNEQLARLIGQADGRLDAIYVCPHHPDFTGECDCRKPAPGMVLQAQADFGLHLGESWMIGDSVTDIRLARNAGTRAALVRTGKGGSDAGPGDLPDAAFDSVVEAVRFILGEADCK
jgi:histidinol-phosphate phosphatase family protein